MLKKIILFLTVLGFFVFNIGFIITSIITIIHGFRNPELTATQLFIWFWNNYKIFFIGSFVDCIILAFLKNKY